LPLKFLPDDVAQGLIVFLFFFATLIATKFLLQDCVEKQSSQQLYGCRFLRSVRLF
jgi:hypothetical protein